MSPPSTLASLYYLRSVTLARLPSRSIISIGPRRSRDSRCSRDSLASTASQPQLWLLLFVISTCLSTLRAIYLPALHARVPRLWAELHIRQYARSIPHGTLASTAATQCVHCEASCKYSPQGDQPRLLENIPAVGSPWAPPQCPTPMPNAINDSFWWRGKCGSVRCYVR